MRPAELIDIGLLVQRINMLYKRAGGFCDQLAVWIEKAENR